MGDRRQTISGAISGSGSSPTNEDVGMIWTQDPNKLVIEPDYSGNFKPKPTEVVHKIVKIMTSKFDEPWKTWKQVPQGVRDLWFKEFQKAYQWHPQHSVQIRKNFETRGGNRLKDMFNLARQNNMRPPWMTENIWNTLQNYWKSPEFKEKSEQAKKNRSSDVDGLGTSLHTGGSIPMTEHKRRLEIREGKEVMDVDLFLATHQKKDKSWVDNRSAKTYEKWANTWKDVEMSQESEELSSQNSVKLTQDQVWARDNRTKRGTIYGIGGEGGKYKSATSQCFSKSSYIMEEQSEREKKTTEEIEALKEENSSMKAQMDVMMKMLNDLQKGRKKKNRDKKSKNASTSQENVE